MRKFTVAMVALFAIVAIATSSYASNQVQVTLTSPVITKTGCEKAGAVTFAFDAGSVITVGDYWYMDLPNNVTFCKPIDYVVVRGNGFSGTVRTKTTDMSFANFSLAGMALTAVGTTNVGVITGSDAGATGTPANSAVTAGNIALRVKAASGQRRLYVYAIGASGSANKITVSAGRKFSIKVLDGKEWNALDTTGTLTAASNTLILTDNIDGDGIFGETPTGSTTREIIDATYTAAEPAVENTLCLNASAYTSSDLVYVSFASLSDKFTFTGDSQIAHTGTANPIALKSCKGNASGDILIGGQNACSFTYESAVSGYCSSFTGNKILVNTTSTFGDIDDRFDVVLESTVSGTYFGGDPSLKTYTSSEDQCSATGTALSVSWAKYVSGTLYTGTYPGSTCATTTSNRVSKVRTLGGAFTLNSPVDDLWIDLPTMVYDVTTAGTLATVKVSLEKYPCGEMFTGNVTLGSYVAACTSTSSTATTLRFPFMTAFDGSDAPWWSGFVITNHSAAAGTIVLTFNDVNGNSATYTTGSIAAGGQFNSSLINVSSLTQSTADAGGDFGAAHYSVTAVCNFGSARGFVFMGNGDEGTGYVVND